MRLLAPMLLAQPQINYCDMIKEEYQIMWAITSDMQVYQDRESKERLMSDYIYTAKLLLEDYLICYIQQWYR